MSTFSDLIHCTNEPNVSIPHLANLLIERSQNASWVVVLKSLITTHHLLAHGNEVNYHHLSFICLLIAFNKLNWLTDEEEEKEEILHSKRSLFVVLCKLKKEGVFWMWIWTELNSPIDKLESFIVCWFICLLSVQNFPSKRIMVPSGNVYVLSNFVLQFLELACSSLRSNVCSFVFFFFVLVVVVVFGVQQVKCQLDALVSSHQGTLVELEI